MKPIAYIETDFKTKFGIPRQSGFVPELKGRVVFLPEYSREEAFRGLSDFSHIWLIWEFSEAKREEWSPTVRPPRLGGNKRIGVFATRSPFRPNNIGLSCVKLEKIEFSGGKAVLFVSGADLLDGTPIFDVKPYIPAADCVPTALAGYTAETVKHLLFVDFPEELLNKIPVEKRAAIKGVLAQDPRPAYIEDRDRVYGVEFAGFDVRFTVEGDRLTVIEIEKSEG